MRTALNLLHGNGYKIVIFSNQGMVKSAVDGKKAEQIGNGLRFSLRGTALALLLLGPASFFASVLFVSYFSSR